MRSLGVYAREYDIEKDASKEAEMKQKLGGGRSLPTIDIEGTMIRGFNASAIKAALDRHAR